MEELISGEYSLSIWVFVFNNAAISWSVSLFVPIFSSYLYISLYIFIYLSIYVYFYVYVHIGVYVYIHTHISNLCNSV